MKTLTQYIEQTNVFKLSALLISPLIVSCSNLVDSYNGPPSVDIPETWNHQLVSSSNTEAELGTWWKKLNDPVLNKIIETTRKNNLDIKISYSRVMQARSLYGVSKSSDLPTIRGRASLSQQDIPLLVDRVNTNRSLLTQTVWEADLFGRIKSLKDSSKASYEAAAEAHRDMIVLQLSEVVVSYAEARSLQQRIRFATQNVKIQKESLNLAKARFSAELVSELDVKQAEQNLANTESQIPLLRAGLERSINKLSTLTGQLPGTLKKQITQSKSQIKGLPKRLSFIPRDLLRQRPDIRLAERRLASQAARVGVAQADLYPRFTLGGVFGFSTNSGSLLSNASKTWSFGPQLSWNIFSGGRIKNQIKLQKQRLEEERLQYEKAVLTGFAEVENSLTNFGEQMNRTRHLEKSVKSARLMVEIVKSRYTSGLAEFQPLLDAERSLFIAEDRLAEAHGMMLVHYASIYRSFGGGWQKTLKSK